MAMATSSTMMKETEAPHHAKKSVENTVFVRFEPSSNLLRRHHVEDVFSEVGPIKKCSIIHSAASSSSASSFGFVKFTAPEDAELAAVQLNRRKIKVDSHLTVTVHCELAKKQPQQQPQHQKHHHPSHRTSRSKQQQQQQDNDDEDDPSHYSKKKTNRLILRNLSFYAKEKDIRQALEPLFGELLEVHIPQVNVAVASSSSNNNNRKGTAVIATHRGFAFVTLASDKAVQKCLKMQDNESSPAIVIKDRPVQIARSLHKTAHQAQQAKQKLTTRQQQQQQQSFGKKKDNKEPEHRPIKDDKEEQEQSESNSEEEMDEKEDEEEESSSSSESEGDNNDENSDSDDDDDDVDGGGSTSKKESRQRPEKDETAVQEKRCLFLRNLPFDCTRHDIFETFRPFGFITAIYLVKDKETGKVPRGTAFVSFQKAEQAAAALEAATAASSFVSQRNATVEEPWEHRHTVDSGGIVVKGRRLLVDLAVDKSTALTLTAGETKKGDGESSKDRRNLYLKGEGRVENDEASGVHAWDELPETDKLKRQTAWSEKNTKLRSPLFFINPNRLSFRNLAKHVTESDLKQLCVDAIQRGMDRGLVTAEDQIALWRASGEMTTREILARIQEADDSKTSILPAFDPKNVKQFIPSVHVHRDYVPGANKQAAPSRGFGFVEFEHHAHALACLREVNNNPRYSAEFATGGKQAADMKRKRAGKKPRGMPTHTTGEDALASDSLLDPSGKVRTPRLIVEFTVENKAKAKQQAAHRAQQQANQMKQLEERQQKKQPQQPNSKANKAKKSRGAKQREKKRKILDGGAETESAKAVEPQSTRATHKEPEEKTKKPQSIKPPKKQKLDKAEEKFTRLVEEFKQDAVALVSSGEKTPAKKAGKRWFE